MRRTPATWLGTIPLLAAASAAPGQSASPAAFVANNGSLEGSVTALRIRSDGSLEVVNRVVTGTRTSTTQPCAGCNATSIALSPSGRFVAASHAAGDAPLPDGISILEVHPDGSISLRLLLALLGIGSPLDLLWVSESHLAVTRTNLSGGSQVATYRFDPESSTLSLVEVEPAGVFSTALAFDPVGSFLLAQDSSGYRVRSYLVEPSGAMTLVGDAASNSVYPLGIGLSPDGRWLYGGGGISSGSHAIVGFSIDLGVPSVLAGSPFYSPGTSPKQVVVADDGEFAFAAHGTDATIRAFALDGTNGALTPTGFSYDVGVQGSLGELATRGSLLLATDRDTIGDGVRGVRSFRIAADGSLVENGPITDTLGISPNGVAIWILPPPGCPADLDDDGEVDAADLSRLLADWGACPPKGPCPADLDGSGEVDAADLSLLLAAWGACPR